VGEQVVPLALGRTELALREAVVAGRRLWVLDEGHPESAYGGNKLRKLSWVLADALARRATDVVTFGAVGSHHVLATAIHGSALGLRVHALWIPQPDHPYVRRQARRAMTKLTSWRAVLQLPSLPGATARRMAEIVAGGGRPYTIPPGGSSALGTAGWVAAGRDLAERVPGVEVVVASGSGGTAAGLWAGGCDVRAVRVGPRSLTHRARLMRLGTRAARYRSWPGQGGRLEVDGSWLAGGYGHTDRRTEEAMAAGRAVGWPMEPTYTAKALAAALHFAGDRPVCFVQTASAVAPEVGDDSEVPLPTPVRSLLLATQRS